MGFHKRFITKQIILATSQEHLKTLFGADALLFSDEWSSQFYELYNEGVEYNEIIKKLK